MTDLREDEEILDTSDVDKHIGEYVGGGQLKEPVTLTDIRRWVQAMQYPNPRRFDEEAAASTQLGEIVAPQSFTVCCDVGEGMTAAIVGRIQFAQRLRRRRVVVLRPAHPPRRPRSGAATV